jgi:hypothetical protein
LEGRSQNARYARACMDRRTKVLRANREHGVVDRKGKPKNRGTVTAIQRKSVDHGAHAVVGLRARNGVTMKAKESLCTECMGQSWRRPPSPSYCKCGNRYEAEPKPEASSPLQSNMGTIVREGRLYGYAGHGGTQHAKN